MLPHIFKQLEKTMSDRRFRQAMERARYDHHVSDSYEMAIQDRVLMADRIQELKATIERVRGLFAECVPVIANSRNTHSVRDGLEQGGYIKYIEMPRTTYIAFKAALETEDE